jgi:hypothetical protein
MDILPFLWYCPLIAPHRRACRGLGKCRIRARKGWKTARRATIEPSHPWWYLYKYRAALDIYIHIWAVLHMSRDRTVAFLWMGMEAFLNYDWSLFWNLRISAWSNNPRVQFPSLILVTKWRYLLGYLCFFIFVNKTQHVSKRRETYLSFVTLFLTIMIALMPSGGIFPVFCKEFVLINIFEISAGGSNYFLFISTS